MDDRRFIVGVSKTFKDQFVQFHKERYAMIKRFNNNKLKLKQIAYTNILNIFMF